EDPEDPRLQRRTLLEGVDTADDAEPGLLDDFVGDRSAPDVRERDPSKRCVIKGDDGREGGLVTSAKSRAKVALAELDRAHSHTGSTRRSSRPSAWTRSSKPKRCDWSDTTPTKAVAPSCGSSDMPANADPSRSLSRPRTTMRYVLRAESMAPTLDAAVSAHITPRRGSPGVNPVPAAEGFEELTRH